MLRTHGCVLPVSSLCSKARTYNYRTCDHSKVSSTFGFSLGTAWILVCAAVLGLLGGYAFHRAWRRILPLSWTRQLKQQLPQDLRGMLTSEEPSEMLRHYKAVLLKMLAYAGRNAAGLSLGLVPLTAFFLLLAAWDPSRRIAAEVEAHPAAFLTGWVGGQSPWRLRGGRMFAERTDLRDFEFPVAGRAIERETLAKKHAFCASGTSCMLFEMMLFETHASPLVDLGRSVVVRPAFFDRNPLWPYVNDMEFLFFLAAVPGSGAAVWAHRKRRVKER